MVKNHGLLVFLNHSVEKEVNLDFLPVKKNISSIISIISIFNKNDYGEGIFGLGNILSKNTYKSSEIKNTKNIKFIKGRNYGT